MPVIFFQIQYKYDFLFLQKNIRKKSLRKRTEDFSENSTIKSMNKTPKIIELKLP